MQRRGPKWCRAPSSSSRLPRHRHPVPLPRRRIRQARHQPRLHRRCSHSRQLPRLSRHQQPALCRWRPSRRQPWRRQSRRPRRRKPHTGTVPLNPVIPGMSRTRIRIPLPIPIRTTARNRHNRWRNSGRLRTCRHLLLRSPRKRPMRSRRRQHCHSTRRQRFRPLPPGPPGGTRRLPARSLPRLHQPRHPNAAPFWPSRCHSRRRRTGVCRWGHPHAPMWQIRAGAACPTPRIGPRPIRRQARRPWRRQILQCRNSQLRPQHPRLFSQPRKLQPRNQRPIPSAKPRPPRRRALTRRRHRRRPLTTPGPR